jgi:hypothetical protein
MIRGGVAEASPGKDERGRGDDGKRRDASGLSHLGREYGRDASAAVTVSTTRFSARGAWLAVLFKLLRWPGLYQERGEPSAGSDQRLDDIERGAEGHDPYRPLNGLTHRCAFDPLRFHRRFVTGSVAAPAGPGFDGVDLAAWPDGFEEIFSRVAGLSVRPEPRRTARSMPLGPLSTVERKSCWWLAEQAGVPSPDAMQRLLPRRSRPRRVTANPFASAACTSRWSAHMPPTPRHPEWPACAAKRTQRAGEELSSWVRKPCFCGHRERRKLLGRTQRLATEGWMG